MIPFLFFLFSGIAVTSAVFMVLHRNPIYSALFLILTLFSLAGHFVLLNAPFIAAVHIIVYAGAIMVLFLFVIMLLSASQKESFTLPSRPAQLLGTAAALALLIELGMMLRTNSTDSHGGLPVSTIGDTKSIGQLLFTKYLFPFEITSVLLLAAIIGAIILAKRRVE